MALHVRSIHHQLMGPADGLKSDINLSQMDQTDWK